MSSSRLIIRRFTQIHADGVGMATLIQKASNHPLSVKICVNLWILVIRMIPLNWRMLDSDSRNIEASTRGPRMLSHEDNKLVSQVGPGTPMGNLFRLFWLPALTPDKLSEPDGPPVTSAHPGRGPRGLP